MVNLKQLKCAGVYQIRNIVNGKVYVGSSSDMQARRREHLYELRKNIHSNRHLQNAYNKYGKGNFVFEVLEFLPDITQQWEREQYWIDTLHACNKSLGYNIQPMAEKPTPVHKPVICLETKEIFESLNAAGLAKGCSAADLSSCCNGVKVHTVKGLHWLFLDDYNNKTEQEIIEILNKSRYKCLIRLEDRTLFRSYTETGFSKSSINRVCREIEKGNYATVKGQHFVWYDYYKTLSEEDIKLILNRQPNTFTSGEIICVETLEVFKHARDVMLQKGFNDSAILNCCYKKSVRAYNLHWLFKEEYDKLSQLEIKKVLNTKSDEKIVRCVVCLNTREHFYSVKEAAIRYNTNCESIINCCKHKRNSIWGLCFVYKEEYTNLTESDIQNMLNSPHVQKAAKRLMSFTKKVQCVETGEIFDSVTLAAKAVKGETSNISKCCKKPNCICKGYHWRYVE